MVEKSSMHIVKQIIEKADIRLFFALWQPVAAVEYQFGFQRKKPLPYCPVVAIAELEKLMTGRGEFLFLSTRPYGLH